jgi:hypothetical protein
MTTINLSLSREELVTITAALGQYIKRQSKPKHNERPSEMACRVGSMRILEARLLSEYVALGTLPGLRSKA